jgi:hypothetical protein
MDTYASYRSDTVTNLFLNYTEKSDVLFSKINFKNKHSLE